MSIRNPQQRGEYYQTLSKIKGPGRTGAWSELTTPLQVGEFNNTTGYVDRGGRCHPAHSWLTVSIHAREIRRYFAGEPPAPGVRAATRSQIINETADPRLVYTLAELQAAPTVIRRPTSGSFSFLQARITWTDDTATQTEVIVDIGSGYVGSFYARHCRVEFLLPDNAVTFTQVQASDLNPNAYPALQDGAGLYIDSFLQVSYSASETAPVGQPLGKRTARTVLGGGESIVVKVPDQAQAVSVYGDGVSADWLIEPSLPATVMPLVEPVSGLRPFDVQGHQTRPDSAPYLLLSNTDSVAVRDVAAVWELGL